MQKLAIVGSHRATRMSAPFHDLNYDIWAFNEAVEVYHFPRWTALMQIHKEENYTASHNWVDDFQKQNTSHWNWLQTNHGPDKIIWMQNNDPRVPNSRKYPLDEILAQPWAKRKWITSTASFSLALGIYLGYKDIDVYGIELSSNTEYYAQLHNWQYWVGVADGMGINLTLHSGEMHFQDRLYGYEGETQIERSFYLDRAAAFDKAWKQAEFNVEKIKRNLDTAIQEGKQQDIPKLIIEMREACIASGMQSGAMGEAERYGKRNDPISRQEFELRSVQADRDGENHKAQMYHNNGKMEYAYNVWMQQRTYPTLAQMREFIKEMTLSAYNLGAHLGISLENHEYIKQYDDRLTAAGGQRAILALQEA